MEENPTSRTPVVPQERLFSPREFAAAIGASESSVKRWVDAGELVAAKTAGGHRRIALTEAVRFIRQRGMSVVDAKALGIADVTSLPPELATVDVTADLLVDLVINGNADQARGLIVSSYLRGDSLAGLCDGPIRQAMDQIGKIWCERREGIFVEHQATDVFVQAVQQIRSLIPMPTNGAPRAMGAAIEGDPYLLPTLMAAAVLADDGFIVINLGAETPVDVLAQAAIDQKVSLVWLSVSSSESPERVRSAAIELSERLVASGIEIVIGGRGLEGVELPSLPNVLHENDMQSLDRVARRVFANGH